MTLATIMVFAVTANLWAVRPPAPPPAPTVDLQKVPAELPFACEPLSLADVLREAAENNPQLESAELDVEIAEASILEALGAFDLTVTANANFSVQEQPQRGSQFAFQRGTRSGGFGFGFERRLETGGQISLTLDTQKARLTQPLDVTNPAGGSQVLQAFSVRPTLSITHPLLQGVGLKVNRAQVHKAELATTSAEADRLDVAQDLARSVVVGYWKVLYAHRNWNNRQRSLDSANRQLQRTEVLVRKGRKSQLDRKAVQQAVAAREAELYKAETAVLDASLELRALMGQRPSSAKTLGVFPVTDPEVQPRDIDIAREVERTLSNHPKIRGAELRIASRQIDEKVAANNRLPRLDAGLSLTPQGRAIDTAGDPTTGAPGSRATWGEAFGNMFDSTGFADWTVQGDITLRWDVRNRQAKGAYQRAERSRKQAEVELEALRQGLEVDVIRAANRVRTASKVMDAAQLSHELARENLEAEETKLQAGRASAYDVLLRLEDADEAATEALRARTDYLEALVELQALNGEILPAYGLEA